MMIVDAPSQPPAQANLRMPHHQRRSPGAARLERLVLEWFSLRWKKIKNTQLILTCRF